MAKRSLLLVDGDAKSLRVLEVSLKKAGFNVTTAMSGRDALEKAKNAQPDLVISDTDLLTADSDPDALDGYAFCHEFKDNPEWAEIPFVFLTGQTAIEHKIKGLELGVDDYLTKPIYIKEILTRARILLQKRDRANFEQKKDNNTRFAGRLNDMGVVDLIQTIEVSRKTGVIHFRADEKRQATLFFKEGRVIDAEAGHLQGEDAVYRLLTWSDGEFEALFRPVRRKPVIEMSAQGLLMEGMRRLDEWGRLQEQLPPLTQVFEVVYDELWDRLSDLPDDLNQILRLFDSRRTLAEVIDGSNTGDLEAVEIISKLYFEGIIVEVGGGQGTPSGSFPVDALLKQRNRPTVPPDLEDTVPEQARVHDASDDGCTTSDPLDLARAASRAIADSDRAAAEERGLLGSEEVPTPIPDPSHLANMLEQAITEAEPLAASESPADSHRKTTRAFAVAQFNIDSPLSTRTPVPVAATAALHVISDESDQGVDAPPAESAASVDTESADEAGAESATDIDTASGDASIASVDSESEETTGADASAPSDYEIEADYPDGDDEAPERPYIEEVRVAGVISSAGAVNAAVSGSLAITTLPTPSKMPKPGFEDDPEPDKTAAVAAPPKKKSRFGARTASISSYDEVDDDSEPTGGFPAWLGVAAVAAGVLAVVLISGRDARTAAQASSSDAGAVTAQPSIGTPLSPTQSDAGIRPIAAPPATDAAVAVATPDPIKSPDPIKTPDPIQTPDPDQVSPEEKIKELIAAARRAERNQDRLEALLLLDEALEIRKSSTVLALKAELLVSLGDSAAALVVADELTRVAPRRAQGWRIKGLAEYEQKDYKGARASFTQYLELAPSASDAADVRALLDSM